MANSWLRLWHDMPNDPKWRTIARVSKQPISLVQSVYIHLLVSASQNVTRGHADVTTEDLASHFDVTEDEIESVISAMQGRVLEGDRISGWERRQPKREDHGNPETSAKSAAERKAAQREREREKTNQKQSVTARHEESRNVTPDKDKETDKEYITDPPLVPRGKKATQMPKGFAPSEKHQLLAGELGADLNSEFLAFTDFHVSKGSVFKNWDAALNTWLRNARKFGQRQTSGVRSTGVVTSKGDYNSIPEGFRGS